MAPITASTEVNRPAPGVSFYATDPTRFHEWQKDVLDVRSEHAPTSPGSVHPACQSDIQTLLEMPMRGCFGEA